MSTKTCEYIDIEKHWTSGEWATKTALAGHYDVSVTALNKKAKKEKLGNFIKKEKGSLSEEVQDETKPHHSILGKTAMRKIVELQEELGPHYSQVDEPLIVAFAKNYERYIELEEEMSREEIVLSSAKGGYYLNPLFNAIQMTTKTIVTLANQLGLSIASRKRMGISFERKDGKRTGSLFDIAAKVREYSAIDL